MKYKYKHTKLNNKQEIENTLTKVLKPVEKFNQEKI